MFFDKNSAAIYLDRNYLTYAHPEKQIFEQLSFEPSVINHLEVKNSEQLVQQTKSFLEQFPQESAVIFLAKPIIFERELVEDEQKPDTLSPVDSFLSIVPLAKDKIGMKVLESESASLCLATNKEYYELMVKSAELAGIKIIGVVPAFLFVDLEAKQGFNPKAVTDALNDKSMLEKANFIDPKNMQQHQEINPVAPTENPSSENEPQRSRLKTIILTIVLIALLSFSVIFSYMNGLFDRFFPQKAAVPTDQSILDKVTDIVEDNATPSAEATASMKLTDLRVKITNGTGQTGQAAKAETTLNKLNLKEVVLDTNSLRNTEITTVGYDPRVPIDLVNGVRDALEDLFEDVEEKEATDTGEFDLLIVTGREK